METERLYCRNYIKEDIQDFFHLKSCSKVWEYSTFHPISDEKEAAKLLEDTISEFTASNCGFQAVYRKEDHKYIGEAGILSLNRNSNRCEVGYNLLPEFWNQGYATEICRAIVASAFQDLHMERVEALVIEDNIASCKVLEKSGLKREGVLKHFSRYQDTYRNVVFYGVIRDEFTY